MWRTGWLAARLSRSAAIRAAAYRDPARWRPLLLAAKDQYAGHDGIQGEIRAIQRRWG